MSFGNKITIKVDAILKKNPSFFFFFLKDILLFIFAKLHLKIEINIRRGILRDLSSCIYGLNIQNYMSKKFERKNFQEETNRQICNINLNFRRIFKSKRD